MVYVVGSYVILLDPSGTGVRGPVGAQSILVNMRSIRTSKPAFLKATSPGSRPPAVRLRTEALVNSPPKWQPMHPAPKPGRGGKEGAGATGCSKRVRPSRIVS